MRQLYASYMFYIVMCDVVFYNMLSGVCFKVHASRNHPTGSTKTQV